MLLALDTTATNDFTLKCAAIGGILTLIGGQVRGWYSDRAKAKRADAQTNELKYIAQTNADIRQGQIAQNGKLSLVVEVNKAYHEEIIRALKDCPLKPTTNK